MTIPARTEPVYSLHEVEERIAKEYGVCRSDPRFISAGDIDLVAARRIR